MELGLRSRTVILTGASMGIGRATALAFAREGCNLVLCARRPEPLKDVAEEARAIGARVEARALDVTDLDTPAQLVDAARDLGGVDVLVNNAGGGTPPIRIHDLTMADWQAHFELNFFSAVRLATACLPAMRAQGWGRIVNISSTVGRQPDPWFGGYSAAKAALINFSKNLSLAYSREGVLTNCIIPGLAYTETVKTKTVSAAHRQDTSEDEVIAKMLEKTPIAVGRPGQPDEIAGAILFLASEQASWISGACLQVDGGTIRAAP